MIMILGSILIFASMKYYLLHLQNKALALSHFRHYVYHLIKSACASLLIKALCLCKTQASLLGFLITFNDFRILLYVWFITYISHFIFTAQTQSFKTSDLKAFLWKPFYQLYLKLATHTQFTEFRGSIIGGYLLGFILLVYVLKLLIG